MPQVINTNVASLNAQRNLNSSQRMGDEAMQRLSSGLRINSAKDDAAGLAISTRFGVQISGNQVAMRNAGDGISMAQTAESALSSISDSLSRVRELALQAANDTNSDVDRQALQEEVSQLTDEIKSIAEKTNFNGKNLLDGSFSNATFQTGANVGDTISVSIGKLDTSTLGSAVTAGISSSMSKTGLETDATTPANNTDNAMAAGDLVINGVSVGASDGSADTASVDKQSSSAIAKAAAINAVSAETGVTASVNENTVEGDALATTTAASATMTLNGVDIDLSVGDSTDAASGLSSVAEQINAQSGATGVTATVVETDTGARIDLTAEDGRNITIQNQGDGAGTDNPNLSAFGLKAAAEDTAGNDVMTYTGDITLQSTDGSDIELSSKTGNIDSSGFEAGTFSGIQGGAVSDDVTTAALQAGDITINGVSVGASKASDDTASTANADASAISKAAAINRIADQTGVTATVNETSVVGGSVTGTASSIDMDLNGVQITATLTADASANQSTLVDAINAKAGQTGVTASIIDGDKLELTAEDGRNITIADNAATLANTGLTAGTTGASITLESAGKFEIGTNTGNNERAGLNVGTFGGAESGTKLEDIDISTVEGANAAIKAVDNALQTITSKQAELGAIQSRFENTIGNLESLNENLNSANSRIQDADFAQETAKMSKAQVLQQAGISILSQANSKPQQVLSLLG